MCLCTKWMWFYLLKRVFVHTHTHNRVGTQHTHPNHTDANISLTICHCVHIVLRLTEVTCSIGRADENTNWNGLIFNLQTWNFKSSRGFCHFCESNPFRHFTKSIRTLQFSPENFLGIDITCIFFPHPHSVSFIHSSHTAFHFGIYLVCCRCCWIQYPRGTHSHRSFFVYAYTNRLLYGSWKERKSKRKWCSEWSRLPLGKCVIHIHWHWHQCR